MFKIRYNNGQPYLFTDTNGVPKIRYTSEATTTTTTPDPYCPAPHMRILLSDGSLVPAGELMVGMFVKTNHETTMEEGSYEVSHVSKVEAERLSIRIGEIDFVCSFSHKFFVNQDWISADNLKVGDEVNGFLVHSVEKIGVGEVVRITVDSAHTYICEGFLSHNKSEPTTTTTTTTTAEPTTTTTTTTTTSTTTTTTTAAPSGDTLMLLRANSDWGPTDEGPNNYYFHNADGYEAGIMGNELASNNVYYPYSDPLWVSRAVGGGVSAPFSTSPLLSDSYGEYSYTSLRGSDASSLLSQMNGDFTIELWLSWYMDSTAPGYWGPSNLQVNETERYFRIGNIELGTALTRYWDENNNQTVAGYKTYIAPFGTYLPYNSTPESTDDIATVAYAATSNTGNIYQGTFPNNNSNYVHIAIVRDTTGSTYSDELRFYMDGTLIGTADLTSSGFNWNATTMSSNAEVAIYPYSSYNGHKPGIYYDDIRISNSVKYSGSTITVPSSALSGARSSASANTELLLHCDSGPADYGINKYYLSLRSQPHFSMINTPTSVTLDTTNKKFGSGSYSFSSSSNQYGIIGSEYSFFYAPIADDLLVGLEAAEQYTIEMWIRPTGTMGANGEVYLAMGPGYDYVNKSHLVLMDSTNGPFDAGGTFYYTNYYSSGLRLVWVDSLYNETNSARDQYSISTSSLARNVWSHVAIVYNNGEWRLKVNGVDSGSSISSTSLTNTTTPFTPNTYGSTNNIMLGAVLDSVTSPPQLPSWIGTFNGNIDEIRFSSVDRYGSGNYTVPTAAFS